MPKGWTRVRARIHTLWSALFLNERPTRGEVLLFLLLVNVIHDGYFAFTQPLSGFLESDAFSPIALGITPRGWVAFFPESWVLSHTLYQAVGLIAFLSSLLWMFKRCLPWAAMVCALAHGLQISLEESLMFNYKHQALPGVTLLILYAGLYTLRHASFSNALREKRFWSSKLYPQWVFALVVAYVGLLYSSAGMIKILLGGADSVDGLTLQMLLFRASPSQSLESLAWFAKPIVQYRLMATASMFAAVLLETGAVVAFMVPWLRRYWALGLVVMQTSILLTLGIPFKIHIALLIWIALPFGAWLEALGAWMRDRGWSIRLERESIGWHAIYRLIYAVDVLGILSPVAPREYASK